MKENKSPLPSFAKGDLKSSFTRGFALALGLTAGALLSVAVTGTVNTFNSGDSLTSSLMNQNFTSLKTAIEGIPDWTKNGVNAYYTAGNVGIGTTSPDNSFKTEIVNVNNQLQLTSTSTGANTNAHLSFKKYSTATDYDSWGIALSGGNDGIGLNQQGSLGFFSGTQAGYNGFKMVLAANGNVGIGTTTPTRKLEVYGDGILASSTDSNQFSHYKPGSIDISSSSQAFIDFKDLFTDDYDFRIRYISGSSLDFGTISRPNILSLLDTGNVGIGTNNPTANLNIKSQSDASTRTLVAIEDINVAGTGGTNLLIQGSGTVSREISIANIWSKMHLGASAAGTVTQRLSIDTNGNIGIGTPTPSQTLTVNGNAGNTTGVWVNNSDERLKKNIQPLGNFLDKLTGLRPVTFEWKNPKKLNAKEGKHIGFIAQVVEKIFPFWVDTDQDGMKWISPEGINAVFVQAFRELSVRLRSLGEIQRTEGEKTLSRLRFVETENAKLREEVKTLRATLETQDRISSRLEERLKALENKQVAKR